MSASSAQGPTTAQRPDERRRAPSTCSLVRIDSSDPTWVEFLSSQSDSTAFHHPAWSAVLAESYGYRPFVVALAEEGGRLHAGLPMMEVRGVLGRRRWISLPFTDYCPALVPDSRLREALVQGLAALQADDGPRLIEIRAELPGADVFRSVRGLRHTLELRSDPEAVLRTFNRSQVRRGIDRAKRDGVTVRWATSKPDLTERFFDLHARTRRRQGVPVQPRRFFGALWERMIEPRLGFVLLAYDGDTPIAAAVFLVWNGTVIYKFGASDTNFWKLRPNHLLFWEAIRWGCETGHHRFDFGRTDLDNEGLRAFKSGWGTTEDPLVYSTIADTPPRGRSGLAQPGLAALIRHSPLWVTRAMGAALYRYAA